MTKTKTNSAQAENKVETRSFQAQTNKLLDLMIHSIYTHKEIFLRELLSNASDALDKARFEALTRPEMASHWKIKLIANKDIHTLTIVDNGVGMSYDEVIEHIGTIAKSGSEAYARTLKAQGQGEGAAPDLIGQFGVGFYSAFMVAKRVILETQQQDADHAVRWESAGDGQYQIERIAKLDRGTTITLFLRDKDAPKLDNDDADADDSVANEQDFTDAWELRRLVKKYSDFIAFPITMDVEKWENERDEDGNVKADGKSEQKIVEETLNSMQALWTRQPSQVQAKEYQEFYRHLTRDWEEPSDTLHFHVEGQQEWSALLYVPKRAPFDLFSREPRRGLSLYIKRVFIAEDIKELIPEYFRFVKGVVDSADLPLNVSRETVQQDRMLPLIRKRLTNKLISHFKDLLNKDRAAYEQLWAEFGQCIKEGFHYDASNKDKLADLLLVRTTTQSGLSTLQEVVDRKKEGQDSLYYLTGDKLETLQDAPQLEMFKKRGVEVILLPEPVDEIMVGVLETFAELPLKSASRGDVQDLPEETAAETPPADQDEAYAGLLTRLKALLSDDVQDVKISKRLTDSAVCLVSQEGGVSTQMERMMQAMGQAMPPQKRILELNPLHPAIMALRDLAARDNEDQRLGDFGEMLLDQALLAEGAPLKNPARFARRVADAMASAAAV